MSDYRRYFVAGGTYFFTVVMDGRATLFADAAARRLLGSVFRRCIVHRPMSVLAIVLLPDHLHCLWVLPPGDCAYSGRWRWLKGEFTRHWLSLGGREQPPSASLGRERRRGVWQRRFWEHSIRDEMDLERHADYIHYNPVRHKLVNRPRDWPWSSFHRWVRLGHYPIGWVAGALRSWMSVVSEPRGRRFGWIGEDGAESCQATGLTYCCDSELGPGRLASSSRFSSSVRSFQQGKQMPSTISPRRRFGMKNPIPLSNVADAQVRDVSALGALKYGIV